MGEGTHFWKPKIIFLARFRNSAGTGGCWPSRNLWKRRILIRSSVLELALSRTSQVWSFYLSRRQSDQVLSTAPNRIANKFSRLSRRGQSCQDSERSIIWKYARLEWFGSMVEVQPDWWRKSGLRDILCQLLDPVSTNYTISDDEQASNPSFSQKNWAISLRLTKLLAFLSIPRLISSFQSKDRVNRADQEK